MSTIKSMTIMNPILVVCKTHFECSNQEWKRFGEIWQSVIFDQSKDLFQVPTNMDKKYCSKSSKFWYIRPDQDWKFVHWVEVLFQHTQSRIWLGLWYSSWVSSQQHHVHQSVWLWQTEVKWSPGTQGRESESSLQNKIFQGA